MGDNYSNGTQNLNKNMNAGSSGVFKGVSHRIAANSRFMKVRALSANDPTFHVLIGIIPCLPLRYSCKWPTKCHWTSKT